MPSRHVFETCVSDSLPIWSCSVWGLPCPLHYCGGGALLPHLFTLTPLPGRYVFCGTFRPPGLNLTSRTLSGTLLCGVRTFLSSHPKTREAAVRSGCLHNNYTMQRHLLRPRISAGKSVREGTIHCKLISRRQRSRPGSPCIGVSPGREG